MIPQTISLILRLVAVCFMLYVIPAQIRDIKHRDDGEEQNVQRVKFILIAGSVFLITVNVLTVITLGYIVAGHENTVLQSVVSPLNGFMNLGLGFLGIMLYKGKGWFKK